MISQKTPFAAPVIAVLLTSVACSGPGAVQPPAAVPQSTVPQVGIPQSLRSMAGNPIAAVTGSFIYVADPDSDAVWIFPASGADPSPVRSITQGVSGPAGVAIDKAGTAYVANSNNDTVTLYHAGHASPSLTLRQGLTRPTAVAVDSRGNVWVSNELGSFTGSVVEFPAGSTKPSMIIPHLNPYGIALDSADNLYVENYTNTVAQVSVYARGSTKPAKSFGSKDLIEPLGITIGSTGDVYVCDYQYNKIFVYAPHTYALLHKVFVEQGSLSGVTLSSNQRLYASDGIQTVVSEIGEKGFGPVLAARLHLNLAKPMGVAADPVVPPGP